METMPSSGHVASAPFDEDDAQQRSHRKRTLSAKDTDALLRRGRKLTFNAEDE
jgi:hypothetical protein